jgi:hypothetical protein
MASTVLKGEGKCANEVSRVADTPTCLVEEIAMSEKKPVILQVSQARGNCPVCGKASYSVTGMHPQCALAQADALTREHRKKAATVASKAKRKSWSKVCPKCRHEIPARRVVCDCGYKFALAPLGAGMK